MLFIYSAACVVRLFGFFVANSPSFSFIHVWRMQFAVCSCFLSLAPFVLLCFIWGEGTKALAHFSFSADTGSEVIMCGCYTWSQQDYFWLCSKLSADQKMHSPVGTRDIWTYCTVMLLIHLCQLYVAFPAVQAAIFSNALLRVWTLLCGHGSLSRVDSMS